MYVCMCVWEGGGEKEAACTTRMHIHTLWLRRSTPSAVPSQALADACPQAHPQTLAVLQAPPNVTAHSKGAATVQHNPTKHRTGQDRTGQDRTGQDSEFTGDAEAYSNVQGRRG